MIFQNFSRFCRDPESWTSLLNEVLRPLAKEKAARAKRFEDDQEIRCWCCGCSSGEEAYYLGMLWRHHLASHFPDVNFTVLGTDVSKDCIALAQKGVYSHHSVGNLKASYLTKDFKRVDAPAHSPERGRSQSPARSRGRSTSPSSQRLPSPPRTPRAASPSSETYELREHAKLGVEFAVQDVTKTMPSDVFDLILSRYSVCLYLEPRPLAKVLSAMLLERLRPRGYFMIGDADHIPVEILDKCHLGLISGEICASWTSTCIFRKEPRALWSKPRGKAKAYAKPKSKAKPKAKGKSRPKGVK